MVVLFYSQGVCSEKALNTVIYLVRLPQLISTLGCRPPRVSLDLHLSLVQHA